jgi:A118 family predicted phage portal protein
LNDNSIVIKYLKKLGYNPITDYYGNVNYWGEWYKNDVKKFHKYYDEDGIKREIYRLGMAKRGCEDWSSILYTEKDVMICDNSNNQAYLDKTLEELKFEDAIPENIENSFWSGTLGTIVRVKNAILKGGELQADEKTTQELINVTADKIIPLRVEHGKIIDVAFVSKTTDNNKTIYYIEIHELKEDGYVIKNIFIDEQGEETTKDNVIKEYKIHSNIPLFSLLEPKIVNNIDNNNGLGISIYANATDQLKGCDIAYNNFVMDVYLGGKKVFYNKSLIKYNVETYTDKDGNVVTREIPIYPDDLTRQQFKILEGDLANANDDTLIHEYNPNLRAEENEKIVNFALNLYSFKIGLGKGYYKFENGTVVTATQYLGENKDLVGNAKKHRRSLNDYTVGIARALLLLGRILFNEQVDENDNIQLTNKDGFLVSDEELQNQYRQDFQAGLMSKLTYLMKARGMSEEQAKKELELAKQDNASIDDLLGTRGEK